MSFLTPIAFFFALALPVVVVFYLLKRKRVVKLVSSTLLWQKFLAETQASAPFQKLRHNWLLILQLLLLALAVFAIARPSIIGEARKSELVVVILDASASMQATDETPSRFERARADALKMVDGLRDGQQMMILLAGGMTEVKQSPTSDKTALRRSVQSVQVTDAPTRLADALKTAGAFTFEKKGEEEVTSGEIHLFSDGAIPNLAEFENKNLPLVYHKIGKSGNNAGVVAIDVRPNPEDPGQRAVFTSIINAGLEPLQADVELRFDGQLLETRPVELPATNTTPLVFIAPQERDGLFAVTLRAKDSLPADNQAVMMSRMPQPVKVLLVTRGNRFLEKALRNPANVELAVSPTLTDDARGFDIVVLDDVMPAAWPQGNILAIHTINTNIASAWEPVKTPPIVDWKTTHPLLRFVSFDTVQIAETLGIKTPPWAVSLVDSPQTTLMFVGEKDRQRIIWIGFDTLQSTWPLRVAFPIFIANAVDWLNPASANAGMFVLRAGDPFRVRLTDAVTSAEVTRPDGSRQPLQLEANSSELIYGDTARQGVYQVKAGTNEMTFCVNLLDPAESNIQPKDELPFGKYAKVEAAGFQRANLELWRWFVAVALALLLFEWWYYHRRTA